MNNATEGFDFGGVAAKAADDLLEVSMREEGYRQGIKGHSSAGRPNNPKLEKFWLEGYQHGLRTAHNAWRLRADVWPKTEPQPITPVFKVTSFSGTLTENTFTATGKIQEVK